jgi:hypothetical protein
MARSHLLVSLIRAGATGNREMLRSTAEAMVADERAKKHFIVADRMQQALSAVPITPPALTNRSHRWRPSLSLHQPLTETGTTPTASSP